jgi:hypothetical protein
MVSALKLLRYATYVIARIKIAFPVQSILQSFSRIVPFRTFRLTNIATMIMTIPVRGEFR